MIDTLFIAFCGAGIFVAMYFRYLNGRHEIGKSKSHVGVNYWGSYAGTAPPSVKSVIAIPRTPSHKCTSCLTNPECYHPFQ
jgi:hypothetical protein